MFTHKGKISINGNDVIIEVSQEAAEDAGYGDDFEAFWNAKKSKIEKIVQRKLDRGDKYPFRISKCDII